VFRAVDRYGNQRPFVGGSVSLSVTGPVAVIGDNPFSFTDTPGVGAIWLRTVPGSAGRATLTAAHPTLGAATVQIDVEQQEQQR
jgi:beta-galactosidase